MYFNWADHLSVHLTPGTIFILYQARNYKKKNLGGVQQKKLYKGDLIGFLPSAREKETLLGFSTLLGYGPDLHIKLEKSKLKN